MRRFDIGRNDGGQRVDKFVQKTVWGLPPTLMYKYIRLKKIKVNGKRAQINQMLEVGDYVEMYIPDEFFSKETNSDEYANAKVRLDIAYEDENIIICDKKPGVLVHNGDEGDKADRDESERGTLLFSIKAYLYQNGEYKPENENSFAPALCNRIDRNTGGLVIAAKNAAALRAMNDLIRDGMIDKRYLCAVHGAPKPKSAVLHGYLFKNTKTKTVRIDEKQTPGSKEAITEYKTIAYNDDLDVSLLEIKLHTGRTHQIRAHMASISHPLVGEGKYGNCQKDRQLGYKYQCLYSYGLTVAENDGVLSYLSGKTVKANKDNIKFLSMFGSVKT